MAVTFASFLTLSFPGVVLLDKVGIESRCLSNSDPFIAISYLFEYMLKPVIAVIAQSIRWESQWEERIKYQKYF
jgi:hypothetical protein